VSARRRAGILLAAVVAVALAGCGDDEDGDDFTHPCPPLTPSTAPAHVRVQHILIGFVGTVPGKPVERTREEAEALAEELLRQVCAGADFDSLVVEYTDDSAPGIYAMSNTGVPPGEDEYEREDLVRAFGDVSFTISPGDVDLAEYDAEDSPFGWHVIKRLD